MTGVGDASPDRSGMGSIPGGLTDAYRECRRIARRYSSSFSLATLLLPADRRPHVYALYAFARVADDIVDAPDRDPAETLTEFRRLVSQAMEGGEAPTPVIAAVANTATTLAIPSGAFDRFFHSMEMDLTVRQYATWDDLFGYMDGSAAVIGEMMLPILEPRDVAAALAPARALGFAFQLTNFLRDIGEDLDRGRQYLPQADLAEFGVDLSARKVTPSFRDLMRFEIGRCRGLYRAAEPGVALLPTRASRCVRTASALYERILDEIEANDHDVFTHRATVAPVRKLVLAVGAVARH
ncbi:MAG: phytoene/squalene synthase family protein [Ilumatobacteraceae bacterium]